MSNMDSESEATSTIISNSNYIYEVSQALADVCQIYRADVKLMKDVASDKPYLAENLQARIDRLEKWSEELDDATSITIRKDAL